MSNTYTPQEICDAAELIESTFHIQYSVKIGRASCRERV